MMTFIDAATYHGGVSKVLMLGKTGRRGGVSVRLKLGQWVWGELEGDKDFTEYFLAFQGGMEREHKVTAYLLVFFCLSSL
jgi:hypothetical protein